MIEKNWKMFLRDYKEWTNVLDEQMINPRNYNLRNMEVNGNYLVFANFWGCDIRNSRWKNIKGISGSVTMILSNLEESKFEDSYLIDWDFRGTNLKNTTFENVSLKWCIFDLDEVDGLRFSNCVFRNCQFNIKTKEEAVFENCKIEEGNIEID